MPGLLSSEEQIPQVIVNVRNWQKTVETLESIILLDTQEVTDSSSVEPTNHFFSTSPVTQSVASAECAEERKGAPSRTASTKL